MNRKFFAIFALLVGTAGASAQGESGQFDSVMSDVPLATEQDKRCPLNPELTDCSKPWLTKPYGATINTGSVLSTLGADAYGLHGGIVDFQNLDGSGPPLHSLLALAGLCVFAKANAHSTVAQDTIELVRTTSASLKEVRPFEVVTYCMSIHRLQVLNQDPAIKALTNQVISKLDEQQLTHNDALWLRLISADYRSAHDEDTAGKIEAVLHRYMKRNRNDNISPAEFTSFADKVSSGRGLNPLKNIGATVTTSLVSGIGVDDSYLTILQRRIEGNVILADSDAVSRTTTVTFRLNREGKIRELRIARSSGNILADKALLQAVRFATQSLPLPASAGEEIEIQSVCQFF
jgi:TonB family protein